MKLIQSKQNFLPFALPEIGQEEMDEVLDTLRSGWLTTGPKAAAFEKDFAAYIGAPFALAVNSATAGLHLALEALGLGPGDQVITTPYTFTATAEVIRYLGADPVLVDIDPQTFNLDPRAVEAKARRLRAQGAPLKALLPVHFAGQACEMSPLLETAERYGLQVVEDAAHALPCSYRGRAIGTIGAATVFSFYGTKPLATGEGGMIVTRSPLLAKRIKAMRLHGISRDVWDRNASRKASWYYEVIAPGFKYNLPDLMAAIGIHQLRKVEKFQKRREAIARMYTQELADLPLDPPAVREPGDRQAWHLYVLQLRLEALRINRDAFIDRLGQQGIGASVHFIPLHLHPYWRDRYGYKPNDFPKALTCFRRAVSLPIYSRMSDGDVERVIVAVKRVCRNHYRSSRVYLGRTGIRSAA